MLRRFGIWVVMAATISGCVSIKQIPIEQSVIPKIAGQAVVAVKRPMPDFGAMTSSKMVGAGLFGPIGGAVAGASMVSAGNSLVKENGIADPAYEIAEALARSLEAKYRTKYTGVGSSVINDDDASSVAAAYKAAPLALDVRTINWGFAYFPTNWNRYRVLYNARMRLVDTRTADVLAEGGCSSVPEKADDAPTNDELVANGASRLKAELKKAVQLCVQEFSSKYLGM